MAHTRRLLVLAKLDPERKRVLGVNATANDLELTVVESVEAALTFLDRSDPRVVVFDTALPRADKLCAKVRSKKALALVPIIGIAGEITDMLAPKLYGMGADDLIPPAFGAPLMTRLRAMPTDASLRPPADRGKAVVADSDKSRGDVFGRVLGNAGYDVKYALDAVALKFYAQQGELMVVVANAELGDMRAFIEQARKNGSKAPWIVTAQRRDLEGLTRVLSDLEGVRVMGLGAPPENVLFTSNELIGRGARPQRSSERVLFGTPVFFRAAGGESDEIGFCYNVSLGGLYVRTLAPAPDDTLWLELRPARAKHRVRLEARVAWRRTFQEMHGATVPPGFGVEIIDGLGDSLTIWREAYFAIAEPEGKVKRPAPERAAPAPPAPSHEPAPPSLDVRESTLDEFFEEVSEVGPAPARPSPPERQDAAPPPWPKAPATSAPEPVAAPVAALAPAPAAPRKPRSMLLFVLIGGGALAGAVAAVSLALFARTPPPAPATDPRLPPRAPAESADPAPAPAPPPTPAPSAPAPAPPAPSASAPPAADDGRDGSELNWNQGYLVVESSGSFDVYATGVKLGSTNEKHLSRCGLRFVRLGDGEPARWKSAGQTVDVKCQAVTRVTIEPDP